MAHGDMGHMEIPADDPQRAQRFYESAFGWRFTSYPEFPDYFGFTTPSGDESGDGAIGKRGESAGEQIRNYISVHSIDEALPRVEGAGGSTVSGKTDVPVQGWYAVVKDTEGNELGLWEALPQ